MAGLGELVVNVKVEKTPEYQALIEKLDKVIELFEARGLHIEIKDLPFQVDVISGVKVKDLDEG